jgi:hypothetical protein
VRGKRKRLLLVVAGLLFGVYVGLYVGLSRQGYTEAEQYNLVGFYYFTPEESASWRIRNYTCVFLFWPLNVVDRWLGFGKYPASEPLWGLSAPTRVEKQP